MSWTFADALRAEEENKQYLLTLYATGQYRRLCEDYCHEGWTVHRTAAGHLIEAGICSFSVSGCTEDAALRWVATHIRLQVLQGILGC